MRVWLLILLSACKQREDAPPAPKPELQPPSRAAHYRLLYAARTDDGLDGTNRSYFSIVEDQKFFVVADAAKATTAPRAVELMTKALDTCRDDDRKQRLRCVLERAHEQLAGERLETQVAVMLVDDETAFFARAGETRVVFTIGGELYNHHKGLALLGAPAWKLELEQIPLLDNTSIVLANREVLDNVGTQGVRDALPRGPADKAALETTVQRLVEHPPLSRAGAGATSAIVVRVVRDR